MNDVVTKPDFLIIGAMKAGTTTLYSDLCVHPSLCMPSDKEPWILTKYDSISDIQNAYKFHFKDAINNQLCGEASTVYTSLPMYKGVVEKTYQLCGGDLKLIMILRDPIERIISHLKHDLAGRHISIDSVDDAVFSIERYVAISDYGMQLRPWVERFGLSNLYCISFNEYKNNRINVVREAVRFLGVDEDRFDINESIKNSSEELLYTGKMSATLVSNKLYRTLIRPLFTDNTRHFLRKLVLQKAIVPEFELSTQTIDQLKNKLQHVESDVQKLIGRPIQINSYDY